jgi:basic membrane protein A
MRPTVHNRTMLFGVLLVLALVAASCSGGGETNTSRPSSRNAATTTVAVVTDTTTTTIDEPAETTTTEPLPGQGIRVGMAYDAGGRSELVVADSAGAGLDKAVADFGIESSELESSTDGENREEIVGLLAESGTDLVFGVGSSFADSVASAAATNPNTRFAIVDGVVDAPNVVSLVFADHEGSALVGAAAALKSSTGKIGFIGGVAGVGLVEKIQAGFEAGAKEINPDIEIVVEYLTVTSTPEEAKDVASGMYEDGADVVYFATDGFGASVLEAAREASEEGESKVWAIGFVADQYENADEEHREYVLTSMFKRVDAAVFATINSVISGRHQSDVVLLDLGADGVGYSTSGGFVDDISDQLDELRSRIIGGDLVIPTELES